MTPTSSELFFGVKIPRVKVDLRYSDLILGVLIWSILIMPHQIPWPWLSGFLIVGSARLFTERAFRDLGFRFDLEPFDLILAAVFFFFYALLCRPILFLPAGSDEPHHIERAAFLLKAFSDWLQTSFAPMAVSDLQSSFWNAWDPRAIAATELWSLLFWAYAGMIGFFIFVWNRLRQINSIPKWSADSVMIFGLALILPCFWGWPDSHPPLRTFFPFLSMGFFGLSPFGARLSGVFVTTLFFLWAFKTFQRQQNNFLSIIFSALLVAAPVVFLNSVLLEPSIYGYFGSVIVLVYLHRSWIEKDFLCWQKAMALLPILVLFRQPTMVLMVPGVIIFLIKFRRNWRPALALATVFLLITAPYFWSLKVFGNGAGDVSVSWERVVGFLTDGKPVMNLLMSQGYLVILGSLFLLIQALRNFQKMGWLVLYLLVAILFYHSVTSPGTWGLPRYQLEYFSAPVAVLFFAFVMVKRRNHQRLWLIFFTIFATLSFQSIKISEQDTFNRDYQALRIMNTSFLPDDQVISHLKKIEITHQFLIVGGTVPSFESLLWMQGIDLASSRRWLTQAYEFGQIVQTIPNLESIREYFAIREIKYLAIIEAQPRDTLSQSPRIKEFMDFVRQSKGSSISFVKDRSFQSPWGGAWLDLYKIGP